ncbi:Flippase [Lachnospiraceae bacterium TWA4]|nr:Flippase [Lachnospiraceae bacterium TWA4]
MPFLPYLMKGTTDAVNIYQYFMLYLIQTAVSYLFFAYKATLLAADQKRYISDIITYIIHICMNIVQIGSLILCRSFFIYTIVGIISEVVRNATIAYVVDKRYPYLKENAHVLSKSDKKDIFTRVYAMSLYRFASVVGTATDNLVISSNISVVFVGLYNNYYMIIQIIEKIIQGIFSSFTSSLGNYYVLENKNNNEKMFLMLNRLNSWVILFCSVSFMTIFQPFIGFCFGEEYLLDYRVVIAVVYNFATNYQQNIVQIYKNVTGLFVKGKYRAVVTAVLNLVISIILVQKIGLIGVFLGSIISRLVTTWWYDAWLLYRHGFNKSPLKFYIDCIVTMGLIVVCTAIIEFLCQAFTQPTFYSIFIRSIACLIISNGIWLLIYGRSREFKEIYFRSKKILSSRLNKK